MKSKSHKHISQILLSALSCIISAAVVSKAAFAGDGTGNGSSNHDCTGAIFCTTYGASWKYYKIDPNDPNGDSINIPYEASFARGATITGCKKYGGYWRYAMVSMNDGQQHGVIGINKNDSHTFDGEKEFGGGMHYREPGEPGGSDATWEEVKAEYNKWSQQYPEDFTVGWGNNLGWFCGGDPGTPAEPDPVIPEDCAAWTPDSYLNSDASHGVTSVVIGVINHSLTNQNALWSHMTTENNKLRYGAVYAKPTDNVEWKYCYFPGVQKTANSTVTVDNEHDEPEDSCSTGLTNKTFATAYTWENWYAVESSNLKAADENIQKKEYFASGNADVQSGSNSYFAKPNSVYGGNLLDPGSTLDEKIWTGGPLEASVSNEGSHSWNCNPHPCTCLPGVMSCGTCYDTGSHSSTFYRNSHSGSSASDHAEVKVPYNFINTATAEITNDLLYSGETANISASATTVTVGPRSNSETQGNYATNVPDAKVRLMAYLSASGSGSEQAGVGNEGEGENNGLCNHLPYKNGRCNELSRDDRTLNPNSIVAGETILPSYAGQTYNVYDEAAGNYYCVVAAVWPYTVQSDTDMDQSGDGKWYISAPSCVIIAKRPSFQVWGAGVYSAGNIVTSVSEKNNIKDFEAWSPQGGRNTLFGSWGELAVTAEGTVNKFASGASTGYRGGLPSSPFAAYRTTYYGAGNPGGFQGDLGHFCLRSPLTIGNFNCNSAAGNFTQIDTVREAIQSDKAALLTRFTDGVQDLSSIPPTQLDLGVTRVNIHTGDIQINGDITFSNGPYTGLDYISKYIIYAKGGSINISCDVTQIDAVLIADGNVNTCDDGNTNSAARSHQLVINGAVVTGSLTLNRSFGANVGGYSIVPAELFNYDSSLYLWAHRMAEASNSGLLTEAAIRELPPRY